MPSLIFKGFLIYLFLRGRVGAILIYSFMTNMLGDQCLIQMLVRVGHIIFLRRALAGGLIVTIVGICMVGMVLLIIMLFGRDRLTLKVISFMVTMIWLNDNADIFLEFLIFLLDI